VRVVVNAVPAAGTSLGVVTENLVTSWDRDDDLHVVLRSGVELDLPDHVTVHTLAGSRLLAMDVRVPSLCRKIRADAMLGMTPATTMAPLPCPRGILVHDLRHELRPDQFTARIRLRRWASYPIGYRQADVIVCNSHRTRDDLLAAHPSLRGRRVVVAQLGADHVLTWPHREEGPGYALAFGQFGNKNVDLVLDAWTILSSRGGAMPLVVVGVPGSARDALRAGVHDRGLGALVSVRPWLSDLEFRRQFASAAVVVFPSDYEGFGLPAVEAMRLGIPVVVTPDPALLEVTGGLATVMGGWDASSLAQAVPRARATSAEDLERGRDHAAGFTWRRMAAEVREALTACLD
jgi:glycosyltransferase involved in cell wall biosynthesis